MSGTHPHARQIVASLFIMLWGLRLSGFLLFRILKTGKDDRFDDKRDKFFPFLGFWVFQMIWVWTVSLPVTVLNSPNVTAFPFIGFGTGRDIVGVILFAIGFVLESVSDVEKFIFRQRMDKSAVCDKGSWGWSRHPNYFGEIIIQFGMFSLFGLLTYSLTHSLSPSQKLSHSTDTCVLAIYMIAVSSAADGFVQGQAYKALYATILGPFFLTILLMFVSGLPLSERPGAKKRYENGSNWEGYRRYLERTSILIPFPPQIYEKLPVFLKRTVFLEFPMYVFDPAKHSDQGGQDAQGQRTAEEGHVKPSGSTDRGGSVDGLTGESHRD